MLQYFVAPSKYPAGSSIVYGLLFSALLSFVYRRGGEVVYQLLDLDFPWTLIPASVWAFILQTIPMFAIIALSLYLLRIGDI